MLRTKGKGATILRAMTIASEEIDTNMTHKQDRPLVISFALHPAIKQMVGYFPKLDVRFVDEIAPSQRLAVYDHADAMIAAGNGVNANTLNAWHNLKFVQTLGSGYNNVDLDDLQKQGVALAHNPGHNAQAVAEHVIMSAMYLLRDMNRAHGMVKQGHFENRHNLAGQIRDLSGLVFGLYGFGHIGQTLTRFLVPFDVKVLYHQRHQALAQEKKYGAKYVSADEIWRASDILVLSVPLTEDTYHLVSGPQLAALKSTAMVINVGRGPVVDEEALARALAQSQIGGAALDVFETEPLDPNSPLLHLPESARSHVLFSPHVSGVTEQSLKKMATAALDNVQRFFNHEEPLHRLLPEEGIPPWTGQHDVHRQQPASHRSEELGDIRSPRR